MLPAELAQRVVKVKQVLKESILISQKVHKCEFDHGLLASVAQSDVHLTGDSCQIRQHSFMEIV